ncbi:MAG: N-acetylneuraminate synthase family protein [Phycisphaeraceae bacterium]|nr:N-acetylneuraminate synthase family protein [Phycisphaerae bacterium]MBX3391311.1 N-acetylneuraminate synthase family protein [Phycisphaeraceae bacterium]
MRIADRPISSNHDPYVIAEIGVNHNGSLDTAIELVDAAAQAGADAVKLQYFEADRLISRASTLANYQRDAGESDPIDMLRRLELPLDAMARVVQRAHQRAVHAIVTVFSLELVTPADALPWDAYKSASPDIIHRPLLAALAATGRPLIISTGASTLPEVGRALTWAKEARDRVAVLQCVSSYPTPDDHKELGGIAAIADIFPGPVGYSDHTTGVETGAQAAARGACILEKHLTLDNASVGPDHAASLTPDRFREYAHAARMASGERRAHLRYGSPTSYSRPPIEAVKQVLDIEQDVRRLSRQSIVARRDLPAGHLLTPGDLTIKRPGTGLEPWRLDEIPGKKLAAAVAADHPIPHGAVV